MLHHRLHETQTVIDVSQHHFGSDVAECQFRGAQPVDCWIITARKAVGAGIHEEYGDPFLVARAAAGARGNDDLVRRRGVENHPFLTIQHIAVTALFRFELYIVQIVAGLLLGVSEGHLQLAFR